MAEPQVHTMAPQRHDGPPTFLVVKSDTCTFCQQAMAFLQALHEQRGDFQVAVLDSKDREAFQRIMQVTRRNTVPQIFLDGGFVGGWDELALAAKRGQLDAYLDGGSWAAPRTKRPWWQRDKRK